MLACHAIADDELAALFAASSKYRLIILAVSGGADSIALMHLFSLYLGQAAKAALDQDTPAHIDTRIIVATVDHGLRTESNSEARFTARLAEAAGFEHVILPWLGDKPATGMQNAAREARYALLNGLAVKSNLFPAAIALAHHRDDQAETVLMRLARGSGIDGLKGMATEQTTILDGTTTLWRPLLDIPKSRLLATLSRDNIRWIDDPSNQNTDYERVRIRKAQPQLDALGISNAALTRSAHRLQRANVALTNIATRTFEQYASLHDGAYGEIPQQVIATQPEEIVLRVVATIIQRTTGSKRPPNLTKLEDLVAQLRAATRTGGGTFTKTLNGCVVTLNCKPAGSTGSSTGSTPPPVLFFCEPGRADLSPQRIEPGQHTLWSRRFKVHVPKDAKTPLTLKPLKTSGLTQLAGHATNLKPLPSLAIATLPSFWDTGIIVFVPHLEYSAPGWAEPLPKIESVTKTG